MSDLFQKQNTLALQNQQTGVSAGTGLGTLGNQETQAGLNAGTFQLEAPFKGLTQQANILNNLKPGTTVNTVGTPSPLNQLGALGSFLQGGVTGTNDILKGLGVSGGLTGLINSIFSGGGGGGEYGTGEEFDDQVDY
jgi:hypothetical protein